jgi:hypothetical protein
VVDVGSALLRVCFEPDDFAKSKKAQVRSANVRDQSRYTAISDGCDEPIIPNPVMER